MLTLPDCRHTITGPSGPSASTRRSAATSIAPLSSVSTSSRSASPNPSSRSDRSMVACRSAFATTRTRGAPFSPSRATSHPAAASTWCRPAASPIVLASWVPVTKPQDAVAGMPSSSLTHAPAAASAARAAGDSTPVNPFWSQPDGEHVGRRRRGRGPADHEAEVARAGRADQAGLGGRHQSIDDRRGRGRAFWQRTAEPRSEQLLVDRSRDRAVRNGRTVVRRAARGVRQNPAELVHLAKLVSEEVAPQCSRSA